jgi:Epoxide hydrolase N terminus
MTKTDTSITSEAINKDRRRVLGTAMMGITAAGAASLLPSQVVAAPAGNGIRPFRINVPDEALVDLRRRLAATRWPEKETVADESQGVPLATLQELVRYWQTDYDWRKVEARLNALPQFITEIDGLDIHFIHVRSKHENALPLIVTHGWPGSVIEQLKIIDPLTNPTAHGANASDAFHLVIPSLPATDFQASRPLPAGIRCVQHVPGSCW